MTLEELDTTLSYRTLHRRSTRCKPNGGRIMSLRWTLLENVTVPVPHSQFLLVVFVVRVEDVHFLKPQTSRRK